MMQMVSKSLEDSSHRGRVPSMEIQMLVTIRTEEKCKETQLRHSLSVEYFVGIVRVVRGSPSIVSHSPAAQYHEPFHSLMELGRSSMNGV